jgi:hypothetical protein
LESSGAKFYRSSGGSATVVKRSTNDAGLNRTGTRHLLEVLSAQLLARRSPALCGCSSL